VFCRGLRSGRFKLNRGEFSVAKTPNVTISFIFTPVFQAPNNKLPLKRKSFGALRRSVGAKWNTQSTTAINTALELLRQRQFGKGRVNESLGERQIVLPRHWHRHPGFHDQKETIGSLIKTDRIKRLKYI
jgi:hypothetical protein